jgi:TolB protein
MDFREVEKRFQELKNRLDSGTIDEADFEAELRKLYVIDGEGQYWMMGAQTGHWYYYDGAKWVEAKRPEEEMQAPAEAPASKPPPSSPTGPAKAAPVPPTEKRSRNLVIPIVIGLVVLCCLFAAGSLVVSEFVLADRPISSFVSSLLGRRPATPGPISTLGPSPTVGISADEYIRVGDQFFSSGRYEDAITQYQTAISLEPQNAEAYARLGQAYVQLGNCDQAIPEFQQALALDPDLESAQAGLMECGGNLPPDVSFASYSRSDLNFSLLYPSTWFVREEELQTIFAENEEDVDFLRGNIFFISALPLGPDEEGMDSMGALIKARQLINLPMGSQLGGVETVSLAGWEWASVRGEITGLQTPTTIYIAATVKDSSWFGIWAIGPTDTWEQISWPIFRTMANTVQMEQVVAVASPTVEASPPIGETPGVTPEASPQATPPGPTPTSPPGASPTATSPAAASPTPTTPPPTATPRAQALSGKIAYPVYQGGQHYEVRIATVGGDVLHNIANVSEPNLRPDGAMVAVRSWESADRGLLTMNIDGGGRRRIANNLEDSLPRWAADLASIVFGSKRVGPHRISQVFSSTPAGGERQLGEGDMPDWSPDGNHIVAKGSVSATGLIVMDSGGGSRRQLTSNPSDASPDWSPTGNKIVFMRQTGINWDVWVINSDGSGERKLTSDGSVDGLPAWSPDGTSIAFLSNRGGPWAIWVMNADGTNQRKLFNTGSSNYATGGFDGEYIGRDNWQPRDWYDEQISWSR